MLNTVIEECTIYSNSAYKGGGISTLAGGANDSFNYYNRFKNITIRKCNIFNNNASTRVGGGLLFYGGTNIIIEDCIFSNNYSPIGGSEMYIAYDGSTYDKYIRSCKFLNSTNIAIYIAGSGTTIVENCEITGHQDVQKPAVVLTYFSVTSNCTSNTVLRNCIIWGNQVSSTTAWGVPSAGGIWVYNGGRLENCTIINNYRVVPASVPVAGGLAGSNVVVINCIIYSNGISAGGAGRFSDILVTGEQSVVMFSCSSNLVDGINGNITSNPSFVQWPLGVGTGAAPGNLDLRGYSPCVNRATNLEWMVTNTDFRGSARLDKVTRLPDIGAYEHLPAISTFWVR